MLGSFVLTASNNALVVTEGATTETVTVSAGTYYNHADASTTIAGYAGFLEALVDALNAVGTFSGTYSVAASTPSGSSLTNSGITISAADLVGLTFSLDFGSGSTTLDPRLLGFGESPGTQTSTTGGDPDPAVLASPYSIYGAWQSPHAAANKRDARKQTPFSSSPDPVNRYTNAWEGHRRRPMEYRFLAPGHVRRWAAEDATIASDSGLPTGDINNAFEDFLWDASVSNDDILVVYDEGDEDLQIDSHTDLYEYVRFADDSEIQGLMGLIEDVPRGESYDLRWHFASKLSDPEYKDP